MAAPVVAADSGADLAHPWTTKVKLGLTAPFALVPLTILTPSRDQQPQADRQTQQVAAVADQQADRAAKAAPNAHVAKPTQTPRRAAAAAIPTQAPPTAEPPTAVPPTAEPTDVPPTAVPPTPVPPTAMPLIPVARVTSSANVRGYPSAESGPIVNKLAAGETITLVSKTPDGAWYEMTTASGAKGYVSASLLDMASGVSGIVASKDPGPAPVVVKPTAKTAAASNCDPSYPDFCLPASIADLDCPDVPYARFRVLPPDPHGFDGNDNDGVGCESN